MDNSLLAVRDINHKYIVVEKRILCSGYSGVPAFVLSPAGVPMV